MRHLMSLSDDPATLAKFGSRGDNIRRFLDEQALDGIELMRWSRPPEDHLPLERAVGRHLPFWPIWLDFWRGDEAALLAEFGSRQAVRDYYLAQDREDFLAQRRRELQECVALGIEYAVLHVSHSPLSESWGRARPGQGREIAAAFADMVNAMTAGLELPFALLLENHWQPGLTFLPGEDALGLLAALDHPHKGFVLDISHLILTRPDIQTEGEGIEYVLERLADMGEAAGHIRALHLNSSLPRPHPMPHGRDPGGEFLPRLIAAMQYVGALDAHRPLTHPGLARILQAVQPEYIVHELSIDTPEALAAGIAGQRAALIRR